jgi:hypothetical protein
VHAGVEAIDRVEVLLDGGLRIELGFRHLMKSIIRRQTSPDLYSPRAFKPSVRGVETVVRSLHRVGVLSATLAIVLAAFAAQPAAAASSTLKHGARQTRSTSALRVASPVAVAAQATVSNNGDLRANFNGVSSLDSAITNFGAEFEPPDQGLCAGNGFVVEMVNSAFRVYDTHGHTLAGPTNVNAPFHDDFHDFTSDPRCHFDAATNTWFAVILFINSTATQTRIDVAYNTSGDPRTDWSVFRIDTTHLNSPKSHACPCLGDQPTLGIDAYNLYTTTNEFSLSKPVFNGAQIYAISKSDLVNHAAEVHFVHYGNLTIGGMVAYSVQPALTNGPAPAEYFLSALDPNNTGDTRIGVWALADPNKVSTGGKPRLSSIVITSELYAFPPAALQKGLASTLASGDDRMQQTEFINGEIWGALETALTPSGDTTTRVGAAWFRVRPTLNGSRIGGATMDAQGYVALEGNDVIYPAIQADANGHAAMVFTLTGANRFPSAAYSRLSEDGSGFGQPVVAAAGTGPYDPKATRWGDYSWAVLDPTTDSVWMATEYIPASSSQTPDGLANWGTRVINVSLD